MYSDDDDVATLAASLAFVFGNAVCGVSGSLINKEDFSSSSNSFSIASLSN